MWLPCPHHIALGATWQVLTERLEASEASARGATERLAVLEAEHRHVSERYEHATGLLRSLQGESRSLEARLLVLRRDHDGSPLSASLSPSARAVRGLPYSLEHEATSPSALVRGAGAGGVAGEHGASPCSPDFIYDASEFLRSSPSSEERALGGLVLETALKYPARKR